MPARLKSGTIANFDNIFYLVSRFLFVYLLRDFDFPRLGKLAYQHVNTIVPDTRNCFLIIYVILRSSMLFLFMSFTGIHFSVGRRYHRYVRFASTISWWRNGRASVSRSKGPEFDSSCHHICNIFFLRWCEHFCRHFTNYSHYTKPPLVVFSTFLEHLGH